MVKFRLREEKLKEKWAGKNDMVPVNAQYVLDENKEEEFHHNMYPKKKREINMRYIDLNGTEEQKNLMLVSFHSL